MEILIGVLLLLTFLNSVSIIMLALAGSMLSDRAK